MTFLRICLLLLPLWLVACVGANSAREVQPIPPPSDWQRFAEHLDEFYFFDEQEFTELACRIRASDELDVRSALAEQAGRLGFELESVDPSAQFRIVQRQGGEILIEKPALNVTGSSRASGRQGDDLERWTGDSEKAYRKVIDQVALAARSLFRRFNRPSRDSVELILFEKNEVKTTVIYEEDDNLIKKSCSGDICLFESDFDAYRYLLIENYRNTEAGKLVDSMTMAIFRNGRQIVSADSQITYQSLGPLIVPARTSHLNIYIHDNGRTESLGEISFEACTVR